MRTRIILTSLFVIMLFAASAVYNFNSASAAESPSGSLYVTVKKDGNCTDTQKEASVSVSYILNGKAHTVNGTTDGDGVAVFHGLQTDHGSVLQISATFNGYNGFGCNVTPPTGNVNSFCTICLSYGAINPCPEM